MKEITESVSLFFQKPKTKLESIKMSQSQHTQRSEWENLNVVEDADIDDELSMTLLERRKRLHELASEINQWEDESIKK